MTLALALVVLVPLSVAIGAVVSHSDQIVAFVTAAPSFRLPPPPGWVADIPLVGEPLAERWLHLAESRGRRRPALVRPYLGTATQWFVGTAGGVGGTLVHLLLTIVFAAILYARGEKAGAWCRAVRPAARRANAARRRCCSAVARPAAWRSAWS